MQKRHLLASAALAVTALGCGAASLSRTAGAAESPKQAPADNRRIAVVYFTKTGNTKSLAEAVRHMTGAALFRVVLVLEAPPSRRVQPVTAVIEAEPQSLLGRWGGALVATLIRESGF